MAKKKDTKEVKGTKEVKDTKEQTEAKAPKAAKAPKTAKAPAKPRAPRKKKANTEHSAPNTEHSAPSTEHSAPSTEHSAPSTEHSALDILFITPEARPFAKTGGLADVGGALPLALARLGHRVTVVVPAYKTTPTAGAAGEAAEVPFGMNNYPVRFIEQRVADGVTGVLIDAPALYHRDGLYGDQHGEFGDNAFRFAVLSRAALEYARIRGRRPSAIHAHDWQAALASVYARTALRDDPVIGGVRTVLTIHNLAFQGTFDAREMGWIGLGADLYQPHLMEFYGRASALKGGVVFSDAITTVSPTYAREILTPEYGFGFDGILRSREQDLRGILNGIDTATWDPRSD
jgi:starch synthase